MQVRARLFGDDTADAGATLGTRDEFGADAAALLLAEDTRHGDYAAPITEWLSGSATAWTEVLAALTPAQRATIVGTMRAYEAALEKYAST
jgi:hypothetical protein